MESFESFRKSWRGIDWRFFVVMLSVPVLLTLMEYLGQPWHFPRIAPLIPVAKTPPLFMLMSYLYWVACCIAGFFVIPALITKLALGERLRDLGLAPPDPGKTVRVFLALYGAVLPFIVLASFMPSFQHTYPFYKFWKESLPCLLVFELFYGLQFFCVEFFFRGYMLFTLTKRFGLYGIPAMVIPYVMLHYHKPLPEALAATAAGVILGAVAYHTKSIWSGVLVHVSVAFTMDALSIAQHAIRG